MVNIIKDLTFIHFNLETKTMHIATIKPTYLIYLVI